MIPDEDYKRNLYDTLIVKDGNVIVTDNIPRSLNIVVLHDNYHPDANAEKGNLYVTSSVTNIHGMLYADGGLVSVKYNRRRLRKKITLPSLSERNQFFRKQLVIHGNLFTENTIGGYKKSTLP